MASTKTQKQAMAVLNYDLFKPESITPPPPATIHTKIRQQSRVRLPAQIDLPRGSTASLPSEQELYRMYDLINWLYFGGRLPRVKIEYSARMTSAGSYHADQKLIRIGRKYHELFPDEIGDTLKHEMIHIKHFRHDAVFRKEARRIGASLSARSHPLLQKPPRYMYVCPGCGREYARQKRLVMASCGKCSKGGKFDKRYKLVLLRSRARKS